MAATESKAVKILNNATPGTAKAGLGTNMDAVINGYNAVQADVASILAVLKAAPVTGASAITLTSGQINPLSADY